MSIKEQIHDLSDEMITNIGRLVAIDSQLGMPGEAHRQRANHLAKVLQKH